MVETALEMFKNGVQADMKEMIDLIQVKFARALQEG